MWKATGDIKYKCEKCKRKQVIGADLIDFEQDSGDERGMGSELLYRFDSEFDCINPKCGSEAWLEITISEYPVGVHNDTEHNARGAVSVEWPDVEQVSLIYDRTGQDISDLKGQIQQLIDLLKDEPSLVHKVDPRDFEEIVAELFRGAGFEVTLTARSKDGGKDIIAVQKNGLGLPTKFFVECKRYSPEDPIGVGLIRSLYGVYNEKEGPNKAVLVTTSRFTKGSVEFAEELATSKWDLDLVDYEKLVNWIQDYQPRQ